MGTSVPRALISTLLIAGVFYAPFAPLALAQETATTTPEVVNETASTTATQEIVTTEPISTTTKGVITITEVTPTPLPTGVLLDNSYSDIPWSIQIYDGAGGYPGHYGYYFTGFRSLGNPPVLSPETAWITTGTTTTVRIKKIEGPPCDNLPYLGTGGLGLHGPTWAYYWTNPGWTRTVGDYCDFQINGEGIPPGTPLTGLYLGTNPKTILAGSHANTGISVNGLNGDPLSGGFAFQLCGIGGCSGGFGSSTPVATTTASTTPSGPKVSNVLFLPGIKGSRLYREVDVCDGVPGTICDQTLWEPYSDVLAKHLGLDEFGMSKERIYTKDGQILNEVLGSKFYASFASEMNAKASSTEFGASWRWKPVAYDWRLSLDDIVSNGARHGDRIYYDEATSTPYIKQTLEDLARNSPTGKVTIVAHSNGGLVAKELMMKLGDVETARLIDKVIFVAVPQSGAPQTLGALLFGDGEQLPKQFAVPSILLTKTTARGLAENSPMAYHLMPSQKYLQDTQDPNHAIISFSGSVLYPNERTAYGTSIDTVSELDNFLLAAENGRTKPAPEDINSANVLNSNLINYANTTHTSLDAWVPPANVTLYQIAGWGADTISGVDFYDEQKLIGVTVGHKKQYRLSFVEDGDEVVPVPSALMTSTSTPNVLRFWFDLARYGIDNSKRTHGDIFEAKELRTFISNTIQGSSTVPAFILTSRPTPIPGNKLIFQLHSPLTLGIYDENGNHTGLNTDGSVDESIPGAEYGEFGDVKYLIVPAGQPYQLVMHGQSDGSFSLDIQEQTGNTITASATLADLPTTASTIAKLSITNDIADASPLQVDSDGNGSTDITAPVRMGETVNYVPITVSAANQFRPLRSSSVTQVMQADNHIKSPIPSILSHPVTNSHARIPVQGGGIMHTDSVKPPSASNQDAHQPYIAQTASVYSVFMSIAGSIQKLLYNIWRDVVTYLESFLG